MSLRLQKKHQINYISTVALFLSFAGVVHLSKQLQLRPSRADVPAEVQVAQYCSLEEVGPDTLTGGDRGTEKGL